MPRSAFVGLLPVVVAMVACSPTERTFGTGGSTSTTSMAADCDKDDDCPASTTPCQENRCGADGKCAPAALDGVSCDAGYCVLDATCNAGVCQGQPRSCPDQDPCNVGACDEATEACTIVVGNEGGACDDGDPCTGDGACQSGTCMKGPDACAPIATECVDATCGAAGCEISLKLDGTSCGQSFCSNGQCMSGHCDITPINEGSACDDGLFCVIQETCQNGFCIGSPNLCPTGNSCIKGTCDEANDVCVEEVIPEGSPCDDGDACSASEFCASGVCTGGLTPTTLFSEDFADNSQGWTLDTEWQIGPAMASTGNTDSGYGDPSTDVSGEGGVAGVVIGGNAYVNPDTTVDPSHPFFYLTSPPINTNFAGTIYVTFYRWLNSDYLPYMQSVVEASTDGVTWSGVWATADVPVQDSAWSFQAYDISAFKSTTTQIRWGFDIEASGVYVVSSWNLDKVRVQNAPCPN